MFHQGFTILHQEGEEHGADIIRQFRKYRADLRIFREMLQQVAVIGTPFFNGLPEGIKGAVAAVVAGLITLLFFTLNPSVKALAMGSQGAQGTDFMVPSYLADHVEDVDNVIVAPTVPYGVCPYHLSFEGSINIGYEGLYMVLHGIMDSLMQHGAKRFVVLNGHGGNTPSIDRAALEVYHKGGVCASVVWCSLVAQLDKKFDGGHGDVLETSAMMAIAPESVHLELSKPINAQDPSENMKAAYIQAVNFKGGIVRLVRDTKEIAPSGWFGPFDPKDSSAELGQEALDLAVSYIRDFLEEMKQIELSS